MPVLSAVLDSKVCILIECGYIGLWSTNRDGQNHHMLMILKSKSNHLNKGDLKSKSKSF